MEKEFSDLLISRLYLGATEEPTDFFNSRLKKQTGKMMRQQYMRQLG